MKAAICIVGFTFAVLLALSVGYAVIWSDKHVDSYYASAAERGICAWAHWTWHPDEKAYCSDDYNKVLDFIERANRIVRERHVVHEADGREVSGLCGDTGSGTRRVT